jgi:hypothetical protein
LYEWDVFEMESPTKCEVRSVIRFLQAKGERPAEIHKHIVAVYGNVMNRQNVTKWCCEFSEGRTDVHDEQRSGTPYLISDDLAFAGTLDRRCQFIHVSLKQRRFYQCQTSTAHR